MTKDLLISQLRQGRDGNQILEILDALVENLESENIQDFAEYAAALNSTAAV